MQTNDSNEPLVYHLGAQANSNDIPNERGILILDANVTKHLAFVAQDGYDRRKADHVRAIGLIRWLKLRPGYRVFPWFGALELSGFHQGNLRNRDLMRYGVGVMGLVSAIQVCFDEIVAGTPIDHLSKRVPFVDLDAALDFCEFLFVRTVGPAYLASLAAATHGFDSKLRIGAAFEVLETVANTLNNVPASVETSILLLFAGSGEVRSQYRQELFKLKDDGFSKTPNQIRKACLSAAWDIGHLQLLSVLRTPLMREFLGTDDCPVLVTQDRPLGVATLNAVGIGDSEFSEIARGKIHRDVLHELSQRRSAFSANRRSQISEGFGAPKWDQIRQATKHFEDLLGIDDHLPSQFGGVGKCVFNPAPVDCQEFVLTLSMLPDDALEAFANSSKDPTRGGLDLLAYWVGQLADGYPGVTHDEAFADLLLNRFSKAELDNNCFGTVLDLTRCIIRRSRRTFDVIFEKAQNDPALFALLPSSIRVVSLRVLDEISQLKGISTESMVLDLVSSASDSDR